MNTRRMRVAGLPAASLAALLIALAGPAFAEGATLPPLPDAAPTTEPEATGSGPGTPSAEESRRPGAAPESRARAEVPAEGGSRLLKALAERPVATGAPAFAGAPVYAAEGCPRALLRRLLAGAAGEADALAALGVEKEILTLCRERQEIVTALFETEARLRELRAPAEPPAPAAPEPVESVPAAPAAEKEPEPAPEPATQTPSPLRAALAAAGTETEAQEPSWGWFSIIGTAGALRAGVTDGTGVWFVRAGDALPGGATVAAIGGRPPSVRLSGGDDGTPTPLPWRALPGGAP